MPSTPSSRRSNPRPPRKKACKSCTKSKVRCDLSRPSCSRCISLGRACEYSVPDSRAESGPHEPGQSTGTGSSPSTTVQQVGYHVPTGQSHATPIFESAPVNADASIDANMPLLPIPNASPTATWSTRSPANTWRQGIGRPQSRATADFETELDFTNVSLVPGPNAEDIRDRWLRPYILPPLGYEEVPKVYHPFTVQYVSRVLATYPRCMLKGAGVPPIIHHTQVQGQMPQALANCYSLVRMWEQAVPGSEAMVGSMLEQEMERLGNETPDQNDYTLLCIFQAYLIYAIMIYFSPLPNLSPLNDKTMITLMELAFRTARRGLFCTAEVSHSRPTWEAWVMAATKRRAIFTMYLFSSVYNADRLLPNFVADELRGVLAPGQKMLWEASDRETWEREYDRYLLDWEDGMLEISELWRSEETGTAQRRERIERWVQSADEFGMAMFAVCAHIHGC